MPMKKGKSKKVISENISEAMQSYEKKGSIGTSRPKSKAAANKQAVAIALSEAGKSRKMNEGGMGKPKIIKKKDGNRDVKIY